MPFAVRNPTSIHKTFGGGGIDTSNVRRAPDLSRNSLRLPGAIGSRCTAVLSLLTLEGAQLICSKETFSSGLDPGNSFYLHAIPHIVYYYYCHYFHHDYYPIIDVLSNAFHPSLSVCRLLCATSSSQVIPPSSWPTTALIWGHLKELEFGLILTNQRADPFHGA